MLGVQILCHTREDAGSLSSLQQENLRLLLQGLRQVPEDCLHERYSNERSLGAGDGKQIEALRLLQE